MTETSELKEESETNQNSKQDLLAKKNPPARLRHGVNCRVLLLDGTELRVEIEKSSKGEELVDKVCENLNLREKEYFSCTYRENNNKFWLNHEKKISEQLKTTPWQVAFEVKFYPPSPASLNDDITRFLLFLQVRGDILCERLPCSFVSQSLLGSYVVQSELGDYEPDEHGGGANYIKNIRIAANQTEELMEKISELHRMHRGQAPNECESKYLDNAKNLALYGVHMHPAKDKDGFNIMVGVNASGLLIYKDQLRITRCTWPKIQKISYKRSNFYIKYRPEEVEQPDKTVGFRLTNHKLAKRLWKIAVEHHAFFRLKETDPPKRNPFPPFAPKFRYSGRTQYQARQGPTSRPNSTLERPYSRQSGRSTPISAPTTPVGTYQPISGSYKPDSTRKPDGPYKPQLSTAPEYDPVATQSFKNKKGSVPFAKLDDDLGEFADPNAPKEEQLQKGQGNLSYGQPIGRPFVSSKMQIENVKSVVVEPERAKAVRGKDSRMHFVARAKSLDEDGPHPVATNLSGYGGSLGRISNQSAGLSQKQDPRPGYTPASGSPQPGTDGSEAGHRPGSPGSDQPVVVKNVLITATLNPRGSSSPTPVEQTDQLNTTRLNGPGERGSWDPSVNYSGPVTTHTYTSLDGTTIREYKTDKDDVVETHIERRVVVTASDGVDHDKALLEAIRSVTDMNPDLSVEKIEIQTKTEQ